MKLGALLIRGVVGPLFVGHGTQKLFGWFGGHGLEGTAGFFEKLGLRPGERHAKTAGAGETIGGLLLTLGMFTPVAAATIIGTMVTAIRKVHAQNGPWSTNGGYEYNVVLIAAMAALTESGAGPLSVDDALFPGLRGPALAALALGAGTAGSFLLTQEIVTHQPTAPQEGEAELAGDPAAANGNGSVPAAANGNGRPVAVGARS